MEHCTIVHQLSALRTVVNLSPFTDKPKLSVLIPTLRLVATPYIHHEPQCHTTKSNNEVTSKRKRKRVRKTQLNEGEIQLERYHEEVLPLLESVLTAAKATDLGTANSSILTIDSHHSFDGGNPINFLALFTSKALPCPHETQRLQQLRLPESLNISTAALVNPTILYRSDSDFGTIMTVDDSKYVIPSQCEFATCDMDNFSLVLQRRDFDLVVVDPPWENKSAWRSQSYQTVPHYKFKGLNIHKFLKLRGVVAMWVTNRPTYLKFIKEELFPSWGLEVVAEWLWLKVTTGGDPVVPLSSSHKRTYEILLLGKRKDLHATDSSTRKVPYRHVITSVPIASHSRKPPLEDALGPYLPEHPECLELFARNLKEGWTSIGNEPLKYQHLSYFTSL